MIRLQKKIVRRQRGFTLLELLVAVGILAAVTGIVAAAASQLVSVSSRETGSVDLVQQTRQFMDQISSDIHNAGYPPPRMFDPATPPAASNTAVGLVVVNPTAVQFEGDVDGSGVVSEVYIQLVVPAGGCPCTIQRGAIPKANLPAVPVYYTEVNGVMNQNVFEAYFYDGTTVALPASATDLPNIKTIKATLNLRAPNAVNGVFPTITMVTEAKIASN